MYKANIYSDEWAVLNYFSAVIFFATEFLKSTTKQQDLNTNTTYGA